MAITLQIRLTGIVSACVFFITGQDAQIDRLTTASNLYRQGEYAAAEKALTEVLKEIAATGLKTRESAVALNNFAAACHSLDKYLLAEQNYQRAIDVCERVCDSDDPLRARFAANLAELYIETGQISKAERLGLPSRLARLERLDPDLARLTSISGSFAAAQGRHSEAIRYFTRALEKLPPESADLIVQTLNNLGKVYFQIGQYTESLRCFERGLLLSEKSPDADGRKTTILLLNIANLRLALNGPERSQPFYARALSIAENKVGKDDPLVGTILAQYAVVLQRTGQDRLAKEFKRRAKRILQAASGSQPRRHTIDIADFSKK